MNANNPGPTPPGSPADIFDYAASLDQIGGEAELLDTLIDAYLEQEPSLLAKLEQALVTRDAAAIRKAAHALASSVSVVNATRARTAAKAVEDLGLRGELAGLDPAVQRLRDEFQSLRARLNSPDARRKAA